MSTKDNIFRSGLDVAVIGMAGRFPGARNIDEFFNNLKNGVESITFLTRQELEELGVPAELINDAGFVNAKAGLENVSYFDASFFGYTAGEAALMDPQMRLFHECAWEALENAGTNPELYQGSIGVYAGGTPSAFWEAFTLFGETGGFSDAIINGAITETFGKTLFNDKDLMSTWISYKFDLRGPSNTMFSSCSTSLVVIHTACQAILSGECDMALAGGVSVMTPERNGYLYQEGLIVSADGHCRAFDAEASGTVFGDGVGIVVLKLLEKALEDNDTIYAVVKSTAVNNDGGRKVGFTAPSVEGQEEVIRMAHQLAEIKPHQVGYVEAHGTGTIIGDPIEFEALRRAFEPGKKLSCALGSVKTNVGHLNSAAGVCGFIKTVLSLYHKYIFPSLNFKKPNPSIDLENSPFYINTELKKWENLQEPLIAGVSSFGVGGTNAHVILCEAPYKKPDDSLLTSRGYQLILFSAKSKTALQKMCTNLALHLKNNPLINLADVSCTLQVGRKTFPHRKMVLVSDINNAVEILSSTASENLHTVMTVKNGKPLVYMFPGQGAQYFNMGLGLYETEPLFREQIDRCFKVLNSIMGNDIKEVLYSSENKSEQNAECTDKINQTEFAQPLLFIFEYALAKLLMSWGIMPYAMIGHSIGEYAAACLSGVFSLEDALTVVAFRGKLMQQLPGGTMVSISLPEKHLVPLLTQKISLAAINSPESCVVSGANEDMDVLVSRLEEEGQTYRRLHTSHAFHSLMMEPILNEFTSKIEGIKLNKPSIPFISNLSGQPITVEESTNPRYWARHLRETVRFSAGLQTLLEQGCFFVEIGPGKTLTSFVNQHKKNNNDKLAVNLVRHPKEDVSDNYYLLSKIGQLWLYGVTIDWQQFYPGERRTRIPLPTYPFEGKKFWYDLKKWEKDPSIHIKMETAELLDSMNDKSELNTEYSLPADKIEKKLVKSWQKFFGINGISIDDDFFELGGDSLKSSIIISRIHKEFNVKIPIAEFFKRPTIRGLALFIADNSREDIHFSIEPVEKKEYYELSSAQKRLYVIHQVAPQSVNYNISNVFVLEGQLDLKKIDHVFENLILRHESFRTAFELINNHPMQRIYNRVAFNVQYIRQCEKDLPETSIIENFIRPFNFTQAPLMRIGLIEKGIQHIVIVDMHHIISDFISINILIKDFFALYRGDQLAPLKVQYIDYTQWHNRLIASEEVKKQERYWLKVFKGNVPVLNLFTDYPRPPVQLFEGENIYFTIDKDLYEKLNEFLKETESTLYMLLLAVCNVLLWKYTGQESITIGSPSAGRSHIELDNIIGMFVGQLPMRNYLSGYKTFRDFLKEVRENALKAYENQDYPFEELTAKLGLHGNPARHPLFDVVVAIFNQNIEDEFDFVSSIGGLKFKPYRFENKTSKTDLRFAAMENAGEIQITLTYCPALFKRSSCEKMAERFMDILIQVIDNNNIKLAEINVSHGFSIAYSNLDTRSDFNF
ncbi:MAG TPA: condensation domain-containing protein [Candidatus Kapabacteria bacterium]|nr:condensation domain-containing protein [Candidatus Kapabacteria bacterium]